MKNIKEIRWIQLSDLNKVTPEDLGLLGNKVLEQFSKTTDFVVITGNLRGSESQTENVYSFLNQIAEGIDKKNIIIVAGDADVAYRGEQEEIEKQKDLIKNIQKRLRYNLPVTCSSQERNTLYWRFTEHTFSLSNFYGNHSAFDCFNNRVYPWENTISLLCINTAYVSDRHLVNIQAIDIQDFDELKNNLFPCLAVMYHDFYEIAEGQQDVLRMKLDELGVSAILCGHKSKDAKKYVLLEDDTRVPIFCCNKSGNQSGNEDGRLRIIEYRWELGTKNVQMKLYEWNYALSTFQHIANNKFEIRNMHLPFSPNGKKTKIDKSNPKRTYKWEYILIVATASITLLLLMLFHKIGNGQYPKYIETTPDGSYIFEMEQKIPKVLVQTIGQIVIMTDDHTIIRTYIIDRMYEESGYIYDTNEFKIKRLACPLADSCIEKFREEIEQILDEKGLDKEQIAVKDIGFVAVSIPLSESTEMISDYYILEDNSLHHLDEEKAKAKMGGIQLTEEIWGNAEEQEKILARLKEFVMIELDKK